MTRTIIESGSIVDACMALGISPADLWSARKSDPDLDEAVGSATAGLLRGELDMAGLVGRKLAATALASSDPFDMNQYMAYAKSVLIPLASARLAELRPSAQPVVSVMAVMGQAATDLLGASAREILDVTPEPLA